jgi:uncharacterized Zn-binding protein involved in type VI secretion
MPAIARVGDACREPGTGGPLAVHPTPNTRVYVDGLLAAVAGVQILSGSPRVLVAGLSLARVGDPTVTGGVVAAGARSACAS